MSLSKTGRPSEHKITGKVVAAMLVLISSLMVSGLIYQIFRAGVFAEQLSSNTGIALFVGLAIIPYAVAYYLFRRFITPANKSFQNSSPAPIFSFTYNLLKVVLVSNAVLLSAIIVQVVTTSQFSLALSILSLQPNALLVTILFSYLSYKFLSWFRTGRDLATLFLGLTFVLIAAGTAASDIVNTGAFILDDPSRYESVNMPLSNDPQDGSANLKSNPLLHDLFLVIQFPLRVAFVFYWIASVILLRKYSKSIGKVKFWNLVGLPLVTYIIASIFIYGGFGSLLLRGIVSSVTALVAGVLFGLIFLTIARRLRKNTAKAREHLELKRQGQDYKSNDRLSNYLMMSVFGTILFLVASVPPNHIIDWVHVPFPPFADVVWTFISFAAYLYSYGLFFSTVAISRDTKLRISIHKLAMQEANLLHSLGKTRMEEELQNKVKGIVREQEDILKEHTGIEQKVTEEEMKQYTEEVIKEIQKAKEKQR